MKLEVRKVSRKPKIVLPKCVRDEIAEKWNVLVAEEERGQLKVVSRFNSPPSAVAQLVSSSTSTEEIIATKSIGVSNTVSKLETKNISSAMGSLGATATIPSVPQARKASLARFLEKRKERFEITYICA
ncbi:hypothetical protein K2173_013236 [Erythroxylum novogranatense]|uniref:Uncharacterized protein n=1 Tax=Erythroxylum novogranatense TaxID=1862640 RepID=A0AAV8SCC3_9ROSI|nr:hypothetical protein K2173_013236 [Erythroxylum novogranatense]